MIPVYTLYMKIRESVSRMKTIVIVGSTGELKEGEIEILLNKDHCEIYKGLHSTSNNYGELSDKFSDLLKQGKISREIYRLLDDMIFYDISKGIQTCSLAYLRCKASKESYDSLVGYIVEYMKFGIDTEVIKQTVQEGIDSVK